MKAWFMQFWGGLNDRERRLLLLGGSIVLLYLAYAVDAPLRRAVFNGTQRLAEKRATLAWMKVAEGQFLPQKKHAEILDDAKGLTIFSKALGKASFHDFPYQLQQLPDGALELSFDAVPYQAFLHWLWTMGQRYVLIVKSWHVEKTEKPGVVRLTIIVTSHA